MDFASCVSSQSMTRPIAESEDGKAVSTSFLITYMSNQQLTSPPLTPNLTHPQRDGRKSESEAQNQNKDILTSKAKLHTRAKQNFFCYPSSIQA